jgi:hypothetical protein
MKKTVLLNIVIAIAFCSYGRGTAKNCIHNTLKTSNAFFAQYPDTIKYLYDNFIAKKEIYEHKELSVLSNDLHLTIKSYIFTLGPKPGAVEGDYIVF